MPGYEDLNSSSHAIYLSASALPEAWTLLCATYMFVVVVVGLVVVAKQFKTPPAPARVVLHTLANWVLGVDKDLMMGCTVLDTRKYSHMHKP